MSKSHLTLYRMTADHTGEHFYVLFLDDNPTLPPVLGPLEPVEVPVAHPVWMTEEERWLHRCNLMDRGWTVLGAEHSFA
ncbi:hypothetical protein JWH11_01190 [Xanthomonas melonis]|uniref:Uncharacterized protein n=1 Tax=Xanthomonas melonis TaxID=56456 RepID=A0ABS8NPU6_9XANT|nr:MULTISPECIES: hypothetical protein [Xanthomonas]MBV6779038.1 hypothetical protein [Xanthomonas campestris pv. carissae]MCD0244448.1 hypothetical protein [Xanthomonas melonis]MCD0256816.1 hypothetical protein [Xanthomonas melonis]MCD0265074.1 hypothetical protein [Xanthomonas melonis]